MRTKTAFVIGVAVGYIFGARAGRRRYEQIKRYAKAAWHTTPVQQGVGRVRRRVNERAHTVQAVLLRALSEFFMTLGHRSRSWPSPTAARSDQSTGSAAAGGNNGDGVDTGAAR